MSTERALDAIRPNGRDPAVLTHDRPVAYYDPIGSVVWATRGRYAGRMLFYSRQLCDNTV